MKKKIMHIALNKEFQKEIRSTHLYIPWKCVLIISFCPFTWEQSHYIKRNVYERHSIQLGSIDNQFIIKEIKMIVTKQVF